MVMRDLSSQGERNMAHFVHESYKMVASTQSDTPALLFPQHKVRQSSWTKPSNLPHETTSVKHTLECDMKQAGLDGSSVFHWLNVVSCLMEGSTSFLKFHNCVKLDFFSDY